MKTYTQKDLGYTRTPTSAVLRITMPDGSTWDVPAQIVVDSRDEYYCDEKEDTAGIALAEWHDFCYLVKDWSAGNMNWDEVADYAVKSTFSRPVDFQEGWVNGDKELIG